MTHASPTTSTLIICTQVDDDANNDSAVGEEEAILSMDSSFKELFAGTHRHCIELIKDYDAPAWKDLPSNPLFSSKFLHRLLKFYMPTAPIWSNLLLGNFVRRYGYPSDSANTSCACHFGRTTGTSECQMRVLKETILNKKIYSRIDEVVSKLGDSIEAVEIQYADYAFLQKRKARILPAKKQKPAEERWNKRKKTARSTGLYTSEKPPINLITMVNTRLLGRNDDANLGKSHFYIEN